MKTMKTMMAGYVSFGDDRGNVDLRSDGLSVHMDTMAIRWRMAHDRRSDDRADTMADGYTSEASRCGKGDSQDGNEYSLQRKIA